MIQIVKRGGDGQPYFYKEFMISSESDVANLPTSKTAPPDTAAIGSQAYTQDLSHASLLGTDDVWREV
jgi:hypothetical protein